MLTAAGLWSGMMTVSTARPSWVRNRSFESRLPRRRRGSSSSRGSVPMTSTKRGGSGSREPRRSGS